VVSAAVPPEPPAWLFDLAASTALLPRGSLGRIDQAAVGRAARSITDCSVASLSRAIPTSGPEAFLVQSARESGPFIDAGDRLEIGWHGMEITHLDALNHFGLHGRWYGDRGPGIEDGLSIDRLGTEIVTRAVFLDIPSVRGTSYVDTGEPVTAGDLERATTAAGVDIEPGDALMLCMGRDEFERSGMQYRSVADSPDGRPGVGEDGARWLASQPISLLAWDFLDAQHPDHPALIVHCLTWAIGLVLVDNCDFGAVRAQMAHRTEKTAMLVVAPWKVNGATGCAVNPISIC
jgi:kynurenine formamidase